MKILPVILVQCVLALGAPAFADGPSVSVLLQITQAGGSLILDLEKQPYSTSQLVEVASSLKFQSTLTIKAGSRSLSAAQCAQIARARPGQVIFWF